VRRLFKATARNAPAASANERKCRVLMTNTFLVTTVTPNLRCDTPRKQTRSGVLRLRAATDLDSEGEDERS
jgi:hypothetical protein